MFNYKGKFQNFIIFTILCQTLGMFDSIETPNIKKKQQKKHHILSPNPEIKFFFSVYLEKDVVHIILKPSPFDPPN